MSEAPRSIIEERNGVVLLGDVIIAAFGDVCGVTGLQVQAAHAAGALATYRSWELDAYAQAGKWPPAPYMDDVMRLWLDYRQHHPQQQRKAGGDA